MNKWVPGLIILGLLSITTSLAVLFAAGYYAPAVPPGPGYLTMKAEQVFGGVCGCVTVPALCGVPFGLLMLVRAAILIAQGPGNEKTPDG